MEEILKCCDGPSIFDDLETQYSQRKYYKQNFNLLVSGHGCVAIVSGGREGGILFLTPQLIAGCIIGTF